MDRLKNSLVAVLAMVASGALLTLTGPGRALASQITSVLVSNDAAHAVPVQGTVTVENLPQNQAVSFVAPPTVIVNDGAGGIALSDLLVLENTSSGLSRPFGSGPSGALYFVPGGKRLVLDSLTASVSVPQGTRIIFANVTLNPADSSQQPLLHLDLHFMGTTAAGIDIYGLTTPIRTYADAGAFLGVELALDTVVTSAGIALTIGAHEVPAG